METYEFDTIKMEKQKAMRRYRTFRKIGNVVRTVEIFVAIMFISLSISWTSSCVPSVVNFCDAFFRRVSSVFFSPHFVFLIGNVIVITLFANFSSSVKSEHDSPPESDDDNNVITKPANAVVTADEAVSTAAEADVKVVEHEMVVVEEEREIEKVYRRTKSTAARMEAVKVAEKELRLEIGREIVNREAAKKAAAAVAEAEARRQRMFEEDDLSNDEFRRKVEQFIEKQQRFLREESKAVVLSNNNFTAAGKYCRSRSM